MQVLTLLVSKMLDWGSTLTLQLAAQTLARRGFQVVVRTGVRQPSCKADVVAALYNQPHQFLVVKQRRLLSSDDGDGEHTACASHCTLTGTLHAADAGHSPLVSASNTLTRLPY